MKLKRRILFINVFIFFNEVDCFIIGTKSQCKGHSSQGCIHRLCKKNVVSDQKNIKQAANFRSGRFWLYNM